MFSAYVNSLKIPELRKRIFVTLGLVALCRLAANIPCPGVDAEKLQTLFNQMSQNAAGGGILTMFDLFSGGALQKFAVAGLGVMPYISASIIMQLMTPVIPALEKLQREGDPGRRKINQYTRYLTLGICLIQAGAATKVMLNPGAIFQGAGDIQVVISKGYLFAISSVILLTAGTMLLVWFGDQITDRGIGNGVSLIITVNILSGLPEAGWRMIKLVAGGGGSAGGQDFTLIHGLLLIAMFVGVCAATVALTQAQRKIPIRHARRMAGSQMSSGQTSHLPLRLNFSGIMPIIFGSAFLMFPRLILNSIEYTKMQGWARFFVPQSPWYAVFFATLIIVFSFFWVANQFNPMQIADNLQKQGAYVPGVRPGEPTAQFLDYSMTRLTTAGSLFLAMIAIFPLILSNQMGIPYNIASFFGGTSMLIMVGVLLDTMRHVESHLLSQHYDGFLEKGKLRSRRGR